MNVSVVKEEGVGGRGERQERGGERAEGADEGGGGRGQNTETHWGPRMLV